MNAAKQFAVWLIACAAFAAATVVLVSKLDAPLGLQKNISQYKTQHP
jgi:hypothetical protein